MDTRTSVAALLLGFATFIGPESGWAGTGWYLLQPAVHESGGQLYVDSHAPLRDWQQEAAFESVEACEHARQAMMGAANRRLGPGGTIEQLRARLGDQVGLDIAASYGRCVTADDPRLK